MYYILRLRGEGRQGRVDRIQSDSLEKATLFFMKRKQMDEKTFNKLYEVKQDE